MEENTDLIILENTNIREIGTEINKLIYFIRERQVMMDSDLASLYQIETKNLNKAMKRNEKRFPEDFCFQLTKEEYESMKFQYGTSSSGGNEHGGRRTLPYMYTEQGIAMLSAVLRSDVAIEVSIRIMKTFVEMRKYLAHNTLLLEKINDLEQQQMEINIKQAAFEKRTEERFDQVFDCIEAHKEDSQKIFFDGQIFDAFSLMTDLVRQAEKNIVLIDGYVDIVTLNILAKKKAGVDITIYTLPNARLTVQDIANFNAQYPNLTVKHTTAFHDRFIVMDEIAAYHIGASVKDAGKKCFGINRIEDIGVINDLLQRAVLTS